MIELSHSNGEGLADQGLLSEFRKTGNLEILGNLFSQYMHLVYGVCLKYLQNKQDAQDAVMQIFEKLITEIENHEIKNFRSWLYVLSKNYCLMQIRSEKSQRKKFDLFEKEQEESVDIYQELHPIDEDGADLNSALAECIEKLKAEQKDCVRLFYYQNWSYRQIAEILHLDEKKVKSYLQNAKRNLKICLDNTDGKQG